MPNRLLGRKKGWEYKGTKTEEKNGIINSLTIRLSRKNSRAREIQVECLSTTFLLVVVLYGLDWLLGISCTLFPGSKRRSLSLRVRGALRSRSNGRNGRNGSSNRSRNGTQVDRSRNVLAVGLFARAVPGDVAKLAALVAALAGGAERASGGSSAVLGNVTDLPTSIALDSLCLAIPSKVVGTAALVASGGAATTETAAGESTESTPANGTSATKSLARWVGACALPDDQQTEQIRE